MHSVCVTQLRLVIVTIWLGETLNMFERGVEAIFELLHDRKVRSHVEVSPCGNSGWEERIRKGVHSIFLKCRLLRLLKCFLEEHICIV